MAKAKVKVNTSIDLPDSAGEDFADVILNFKEKYPDEYEKILREIAEDEDV